MSFGFGATSASRKRFAALLFCLCSAVATSYADEWYEAAPDLIGIRPDIFEEVRTGRPVRLHQLPGTPPLSDHDTKWTDNGQGFDSELVEDNSWAIWKITTPSESTYQIVGSPAKYVPFEPGGHYLELYSTDGRFEGDERYDTCTEAAIPAFGSVTAVGPPLPANPPYWPAPIHGDPVNLATGEESYSDGPDITAYNRNGPSPSYTRTYHSFQAHARYGSPGPMPGWADNLDVSILAVQSEGVPTEDLYLCFPNGAMELIGTTGLVQPPLHAPYKVTHSDIWDSVTVMWPDLTEWVFTRPTVLVPVPPTLLVMVKHIESEFTLTKVRNAMGQGFEIHRLHSGDANIDHRITSITDLSSGDTLLSFAYDAAHPHRLVSVTDEVSSPTRTATYVNEYDQAVGTTVLRQVSTINGGTMGYRWRYAYVERNAIDVPDCVLLAQRTYLNPVTGAATNYAINYEEEPAGPYEVWRVSSTVDANGYRNEYDYSPNPALYHGVNGTLVKSYDASNNLVRQFVQKLSPLGLDAGTYEDGRETTVEYGSTYRPTSVTDRRGIVTEYAWDAHGQLKSIIGPNPTGNGQTKTVIARTWSAEGFPYLSQLEVRTGDPDAFEPENTTAPRQIRTVYRFDPAAAIDTNAIYTTPFDSLKDRGLLTSIDYPRPGAVWSYPNGDSLYETVTLQYDSLGNVTRITQPQPAPTGTTTSVLTYKDASHPTPQVRHPIRITIPTSATQSYTAAYEWSADGRLLSKTDGAGKTTGFTYDEARALTDVTLPTANDPLGLHVVHLNRTYIGGPVNSVEYRPETVNGVTSEVLFGADAAGNPAGAAGDTEFHTYVTDPVGRIASLVNGRQKGTQWEYENTDTVSRASIHYPRWGEPDFAGDFEDVVEDRSELQGQTTGPYAGDYTVTDGRGYTREYVHDLYSGALTDVLYTGPGGAYASADNRHYDYDRYGRVTRVRHGASDASFQDITSFTYDDRGAVLTATSQYPSFSKTVTYTYYPDGTRSSMQVSGLGSPVAYTYNWAGQLTTLVNPFGQSFAFGYDTVGRLCSQTCSAIATTYTYNAWGALNTIHNQNTSDTQPMVFSDFSVTRDVQGNIKTLTASNFGTLLQPPAAPSKAMVPMAPTPSYFNGTTTYTYAPSTGEANLAYGPLRREHTTRFYSPADKVFAYDNSYNPVLFRSGSALAYNADDQRDASGSFFHDGAGNPTLYKGLQLAFTPDNGLSSYNNGAVTYGYRASGLRAWKQVGSTRTYYLYDGATPLCEMNSAGTITALTTFGPNGLMARRYGGADTYYAFDPSGNVANYVFNPISASHTGFDAYGQRYGSSYTDPFGYQGQWGAYTDRSSTSDTGLVLMGLRYYDTTTGRFLTRDPIGYAGGINLYAYCRNNPVNLADPLGLRSVTAGFGAKVQILFFAAQANIGVIYDKPSNGPLQIGIQGDAQFFGGGFAQIGRIPLACPNGLFQMFGAQAGPQFGYSNNPDPQVTPGALCDTGTVASAGGFAGGGKHGLDAQATWDSNAGFDWHTASYAFSYGPGVGYGVYYTSGPSVTINWSEAVNRLADWLCPTDGNSQSGGAGCPSHQGDRVED